MFTIALGVVVFVLVVVALVVVLMVAKSQLVSSADVTLTINKHVLMLGRLEEELRARAADAGAAILASPVRDTLRVKMEARRAVIERLIGQTRVHPDVRNPRDRLVAFVAFAIGDKVTGVSAGCDDAVMARRTRAQDLRVVDRDHGAPYGCAVTVLSNVGS